MILTNISRKLVHSLSFLKRHLPALSIFHFYASSLISSGIEKFGHKILHNHNVSVGSWWITCKTCSGVQSRSGGGGSLKVRETWRRAWTSIKTLSKEIIKEVGFGIRSGGRNIIVMTCRCLGLLLSKLLKDWREGERDKWSKIVSLDGVEVKEWYYTALCKQTIEK